MRFNLKVPFAEKEAAKKLGARWDPARKLWYVVDKDDLASFSKWSPVPHEESNTSPAIQKSALGKTAATGKVYVGSDYVERPRVCECLPWDTCDKCQDVALSR